MGIIHVVAVITAKTGMRGEILKAFHQNSQTVRNENGCIEYIATADANDAGTFQTKFGNDTFVVVEQWENMSSLKDHSVSPHMVAYAQKTKDLIKDKIIYVLSPTVES